MNRHLSMLAGAAALFLVAGQSHALLIDGFGDDEAAITDTDPTVGVGVTSPAAPLAVTDTDLTNNQRTIFVDAQTGAVPGVDGISASVAGGAYRHSQDVAVFGISQVDWSFDTVDLSGGVNLVVEVLRADHVGGAIDLTLSDGVNSATDSFAVPVVPLGAPQTFMIPLSNFSPPVDLTQVSSAQLVIDGTAVDSLDVRIDFVATVPEPASLALIGLGLVGFGVSRRRVFRKAA